MTKRRRPCFQHCSAAVLLLLVPSIDAWLTLSRRDVVDQLLSTTSSFALAIFPIESSSATTTTTTTTTSANDEDLLLNYPYSDTWTGTALPLLDLSQATTTSSSCCEELSSWDMGRWPDPILRRPASPVGPNWFGTSTLYQATKLLENTCKGAHAVGLAAQQCGVNARIVFLEPNNMAMINPRIVNRSDEREMKVWREHCLVLPPSFVATVLRDAWIDVEYQDWKGTVHVTRLGGELARAAQHELDHDRGILVLDHVGLDELENARMRAIETNGHDMRMMLAYARC